MAILVLQHQQREVTGHRVASRTPKSQEDIELPGGRRKARIATKRRHESVKQLKGKLMSAERQGESRVTRRTQNVVIGNKFKLSGQLAI